MGLAFIDLEEAVRRGTAGMVDPGPVSGNASGVPPPAGTRHNRPAPSRADEKIKDWPSWVQAGPSRSRSSNVIRLALAPDASATQMSETAVVGIR